VLRDEGGEKNVTLKKRYLYVSFGLRGQFTPSLPVTKTDSKNRRTGEKRKKRGWPRHCCAKMKKDFSFPLPRRQEGRELAGKKGWRKKKGVQ